MIFPSGRGFESLVDIKPLEPQSLQHMQSLSSFPGETLSGRATSQTAARGLSLAHTAQPMPFPLPSSHGLAQALPARLCQLPLPREGAAAASKTLQRHPRRWFAPWLIFSWDLF